MPLGQKATLLKAALNHDFYFVGFIMTKPFLPDSPIAKGIIGDSMEKKVSSRRHRKSSKRKDSSDVLISAVISPYLLTHLHNVLQRAEYQAAKEGRTMHAENFSQLRKVLCMDARSMKDASATGFREVDYKVPPKVA